MALTGTQNAPASPESTGYEIDKMSKAAASGHFDAYVGEIIRRIPPEKRKGFRHVVATVTNKVRKHGQKVSANCLKKNTDTVLIHGCRY